MAGEIIVLAAGGSGDQGHAVDVPAATVVWDRIVCRVSPVVVAASVEQAVRGRTLVIISHPDALAEVRRATVSYHDVDVVIADGYTPINECSRAERRHGLPLMHWPRVFHGPGGPDAA